MAVSTRLRLRDFRTYAAREVALGPGLTVVHGAQRRRQDEPARGAVLRLHRPLVPDVERARGRALRRRRPRASEVDATDGHDARRRLPARRAEALHASTARRSSGSSTLPARPLVAVFLPDRLELIKGAPALRRAHLDQVVAALWPRARRRAAPTRRRWRSATRCSRGSAAGRASRSALPAWDAELARHGDRAARRPGARGRAAARAVRRAGRRARPAPATAELRYRPRTRAATAEELAAELAERLDVRPRARLHRPRPAPRRPRAAARRPRAARLRLAGRAAAGAAGAAAGRARGARAPSGARRRCCCSTTS